jgi:hypothetical protein
LITLKVRHFGLLFVTLCVGHDVMMMMCHLTRLGIALNIVLFVVLLNPLPILAKVQNNGRRERERNRQQQAQEERQSEFVKGKSKCLARAMAGNPKKIKVNQMTSVQILAHNR